MLLVQGRDLEKLRPQGRRARSSREEAAGARGGTGSQERERGWSEQSCVPGPWGRGGGEESAREEACATSLAKSPAGLPRAERERETPARRGPRGLLAAPAAQAPCSPRQAAKARLTAPAAKRAPALRRRTLQSLR